MYLNNNLYQKVGNRKNKIAEQIQASDFYWMNCALSSHAVKFQQITLIAKKLLLCDNAYSNGGNY